MNNTRLDVYLVEQGYCVSRSKAQELIKSGNVTVDGVVRKKASFVLAETDGRITCAIDVVDTCQWVSRSGEKLAHAIETFGIDLSSCAVGLDVGASTGGFTDVLLSCGVDKVYSVDVGTGQLADKLLGDDRVVSMEQTDARTLTQQSFLKDGDNRDIDIDVLVSDVSFVSVTKVLSQSIALVRTGGMVFVLVKPQFEVGRQFIGKNGIVSDEKAIALAIETVRAFLESCGVKVLGQVESPIKGRHGNQETVLYGVVSK